MIATFYIYVDGSDLDEVGPEMTSRIEAFVAPYGDRVRLVNHRHVATSAAELPDWDLGVNFECVLLSNTEKKDLLLFFQALSAEFDRDFVLGGELVNGQGDDFVTISAGEPLEPAIELLVTNENQG